jgi:hypothetical protein
MARKQQNVAPIVDPQIEAEKVRRREQSLDDALKGTFPASDPPAALAPHYLTSFANRGSRQRP